MSFAFACCCGCKCSPVWAEYWENVTTAATACGSPPPAPDPLPAGTYYQDGNLYSRCVRGVHSTSEASPGVVKIELEGAKLVQLHKGFDRAGAEEFWPYGASAPGLGGPLEATVTDDWWDGSDWHSTILVPGAASAAASGDVALYLNAAQCDQRGWKGVVAEGVYIGVPAWDYGRCGELCSNVAPRHYLQSRMTGYWSTTTVNTEGASAVEVVMDYDQTFSLDARTGALAHASGGHCSGYNARGGVPVPLGYCNDTGTLTYVDDASPGTPITTTDLSSSGWPEWVCDDWPECSIKHRFKWTLTRDESTSDLTGIAFEYDWMDTFPDGTISAEHRKFTFDLSSPVSWDDGAGGGVYPETFALLDRWALSSRYQHPWRTDSSWQTVPVVRYDTSSDNVLPTFPWMCYEIDGATWPVAGRTGDLVGLPLPNSASKIYGPHKQFRPPLCTSVPPDAPGTLPLASTYWTGNGIYWGGVNHYEPTTRTIRIQKFALAFAGCGIGANMLTDGSASGGGWTGDWAGGYAHASGSSSPLEVFQGGSAAVPLVDRSYVVAATILPTAPATAVAGSLSVSLGGVTSGPLTGEGVVIHAETAAALKLQPTSSFNGTVSDISMSPYPQGDFAMLSWVVDGCTGCPEPESFRCSQQRIPQPRCGGVVACVSNTSGDSWTGGVTVPLQTYQPLEFGQCADGFTNVGAVGWFCHPMFSRAVGFASDPSIEFRCDDCFSCSGASCTGTEPTPDQCPTQATHQYLPDAASYFGGLPQYGDPLLEVPI